MPGTHNDARKMSFFYVHNMALKQTTMPNCLAKRVWENEGSLYAYLITVIQMLAIFLYMITDLYVYDGLAPIA